MRVIRLQADNFKKLRAIDISPDGNLVEIRGPNGAGKSSILDAIWAALGGAKVAPQRPIRAGAESATIRLDLGELVVTRRFIGDNSTLVVESAGTKARHPSPQAVLDKLIGAIAFDPLEFARMPPKEQLGELRRVVPLDIDTAALDAQNAADYERRRDVNRERTRLLAAAEQIPVPPDPAPEPVDVDALLAALKALGDYNNARQRAIAERAKKEQHCIGLNSRRDDLIEEAQRLRARADELIAQADTLDGQARELEREVAATTVEDERDAAPVTAALRDAQATNAAVDRARERARLLAAAETASGEAELYTHAIDRRAAEKRAALARAPFPVPGLAFGDDGVLLNDLPFDQASQAEKIRVSVALAMAANPSLKVLCVRDGSLLDARSLAQLQAAVEANDYQLWLEVTSDDGRTGVVIEDGSVVTSLEVTTGAQPAPEMAGFEETAE